MEEKTYNHPFRVKVWSQHKVEQQNSFPEVCETCIAVRASKLTAKWTSFKNKTKQKKHVICIVAFMVFQISDNLFF